MGDSSENNLGFALVVGLCDRAGAEVRGAYFPVIAPNGPDCLMFCTGFRSDDFRECGWTVPASVDT